MSTELLAGRYDAALLDLDGTIYEGGRPVPGALEALTEAGLPMLFVTNNASRSPETVAEQLRSLGYDCTGDDVMTSAQAAIEMAGGIIPEGSKVLVLGAQSFRDLATEAGYELVDSADDEPAAVFQGHNPDTNWAMLSEAALAIARGATYLASNLDTTLPMERGLLVGNGSMVAAVVSATGVEPRSAGKPQPPMFHRGAARLGSQRPIVIGDRLNTDIAGGNAAGYDTLMTVTGISGHHETLSAIPEERPTVIGADMSALVAPAEDAEPRPQAGFTAERDPEDPGVIVIGGGDASDPRLADPAQAAVAALLTAASVAWFDVDGATSTAPVTGVRTTSDAAAAAVAAWR